MELEEVKTRDVFAMPTIENGQLTGLWGYPLRRSFFMHYAGVVAATVTTAAYQLKANSAGKVDQTTEANNTKGAILAVRWPPSGDDVAGLAPFAEVLRLGKITGTEPFHGSGTVVTPRNELIVWAYQCTLVGKVAGASAVQLFMNSRPLFILLAFLALFTLLHQTFRNLQQALFLLSLWAVYLLATTTIEGVGSDLITRIFPGHVAAIVEEMSVSTAEEQETLGRLCRKLGRREA